MNYPRTKNAVNVASTFLGTLTESNPEVESYLVSYLLVTLYAEYEQKIGLLVARRCARTQDIPLKNFVQKKAKCGTESDLVNDSRKSGHIRIADLNDILGSFSENYKKTFTKKVLDTEMHRAWDDVVNNRIDVCHRQGSNMTLRDFIQSFDNSCHVLDTFAEALELTLQEIADL